MSAARPPLLRWILRPRASTVLSWCVVIASPVIAYFAVLLDPNPVALSRYWLPILAMSLPLGMLRRSPLALLPMLATLLVLSTIRVPWPWVEDYLHNIRILQILAIDLAAGYIASSRPRRTSLIAAALTLLVQVSSVWVFPIGDNVQDTVSVALILGITTVWLIGQSIRQRRQYAEVQRAQAEVQAVQAERLRIARELHDMIAHSIGVIAIQAGVGSRVIDTQPAEARNALTAIENTSRDTLAGLRRMLGTLRRSDPESVSAPLDPAPGLADLDALAARSLDAGVRVEIQWRGDRHPLPPDIDLSAYRIIQEAVTNVVRHARTGSCQVVVEQRDDEVSIEIIDDGRDGEAGAKHVGARHSEPGHVSDAGTGYGIPGMRERASLLNGEFTAGPRPEGGFRVAARIPVPAGVS
jgi:signal transduction histidine kinase